MQQIEFVVPNHGFIKLIDHMGSDLSIVNAARISFGKQKQILDRADEQLIYQLARNGHTSPFRHTAITFHIKAPIFVLRQWMKHRIASEFNELSGRYVDFKENDFFIPKNFRYQSNTDNNELNDQIKAHKLFLNTCENAIKNYNLLINMGICKEQARCLLPIGIYSEVYWTAGLQSIAHFIKLRTNMHAQKEIQEYAEIIQSIVQRLFPISLNALLKL